MPKEIRIVLSDEEYERLKALKGDKSWKDLLLESLEADPVSEINAGFNELRKRVIGVTQDSMLAVLELYRVITIKLARMNPEARERAIKKVEEALKAILRSLT